MAKLYAGTSGFSYPTWKPRFYPAKLPSARFLDYYATRLNCVEANYTFRTYASEKTLDNWIGKTPDGFLFCPKAHMRITHILKLRGAEEAARGFLASLEPLTRAKRLGPILFQLPPAMKADVDTLAAFLSILPKTIRCAFEFRHPTWFTTEVFDLLRGAGAALCIAESEKLESPEVSTADFVYYRLRKPDYSDDDQAAITAKVKQLISSDKDVFVFYKHEETPDGALRAEELLSTQQPGVGAIS
jgi:uncharacterized protein YecE (DUF72 family)